MSTPHTDDENSPTNPSNPYNSLENSTSCRKVRWVAGVGGKGKVAGEILDRARAYAAAVPAAISGSRGHDQTFALANALTWGFGLDEDTALSLMLEWNAGCQPPWKERDLRHKVRQSQTASHQKPFGYLLTAGERPQSFRAPSVAPPAETATWKIKRRPATDEGKPTAEKPSEASGNAGEGLKPCPLDWTAINAEHPPTAEDEAWQAVEAAGFGSEPLVASAFALFGPGCRVISTGEVASV